MQDITISVPDYVFRRIERVAETLGFQNPDTFLQEFLTNNLHVFEPKNPHLLDKADEA